MSEKIEFNEQTALQIIEKQGLSPTTLKVWRTRGSIPGKYLQEGYQKPTEATKADSIIESRVIGILKSGLINATVVSELAGIPAHKIIDVSRGGSTYSHEEIIALKSEINKLKIEIAKAFQIKAFVLLKKLLNNPAFILRKVLDNATKIEYEHASRIKRGVIEPSESDYRLIKDSFVKTALQLTT